MAFHFTSEDFERYVKQEEHGGRHVWHELQERLADLFGVPFAATPYVARGDRLHTLWFTPKDTPRTSWNYQSMLFLSRSITSRQLRFGLVVECPPPDDVSPGSGIDPDLDGSRFRKRLESDTAFAGQIDEIIGRSGWTVTVHDWSENPLSTPQDSFELLSVLNAIPAQNGWDVAFRRVMSAQEAIVAGEGIVDHIIDAYTALWSIWQEVMPQADRTAIDTNRPNLSPETLPNTHPPRRSLLDLSTTLSRHMSAQGLRFTPWQIATYYTALQTKGFVILSGISGTGKTKLAQAFSAVLPQPPIEREFRDDQIVISVQPYMLKYNRFIVPKGATRLFEPPAPGQAQQVPVHFDTYQQECRFVHAVYGAADYLSLLLRGHARQWFSASFHEGDDLVLEPLLDQEGTLAGFRLAAPKAVTQPKPANSDQVGQNWLFVSVRPDWRDSKGLLGYYNPLNQRYSQTGFLRFVLRAARSYRDKDGLAWFVILDEMNLAHVEYYFADLLSVLESGRTEDGWTREPLRLSYPDDAEGDLPPREVRLPPSLYVVGTVNVDETTHAFSPKVLDRAFTLELTDANFTDYPPAVRTRLETPSEAARRAVLTQYCRNGRFAQIEKPTVAAYVAAHPEVRVHLQKLNDLLRPHDLHFGYRVFDEIVAFLDAAAGNRMYTALEAERAFDAAVLMKVLPKFNGPRGKLERALLDVLAWCMNPEEADLVSVNQASEKIDASLDVEAMLGALPYQMPRTAERARRMLRMLYATGFAAFG